MALISMKTLAGLDLGGQKITNLLRGTAASDAVSVDNAVLIPSGGTLAITGGLSTTTPVGIGVGAAATAVVTTGGTLAAAATQTGINLSVGASIAGVTNAQVTGLVVGGTVTGAGTTPTLTGIQVNAFVAASSPTGTLANLYGINIAAMALPAGMTAPATAYGLYINAPTGGTTNVGLYNAGTTTLAGTATFTVAPVFTDQPNTRVALGLQYFDFNSARVGTPAANENVDVIAVPRAMTFAANFGTAGTYARSETAVSSSTAFDVQRSAAGGAWASIGTITFANGAKTATFVTASGTSKALAADDRIRYVAPAALNGATDLTFNLVATY